MRLPKPGEWWTYNQQWYDGSTFLEHSSYKVNFYIDDVIYKENLDESWVIYSNKDDYDFFVVQMYEFIQGKWEIKND